MASSADNLPKSADVPGKPDLVSAMGDDAGAFSAEHADRVAESIRPSWAADGDDDDDASLDSIPVISARSVEVDTVGVASSVTSAPPTEKLERKTPPSDRAFAAARTPPARVETVEPAESVILDASISAPPPAGAPAVLQAVQTSAPVTARVPTPAEPGFAVLAAEKPVNPGLITARSARPLAPIQEEPTARNRKFVPIERSDSADLAVPKKSSRGVVLGLAGVAGAALLVFGVRAAMTSDAQAPVTTTHATSPAAEARAQARSVPPPEPARAETTTTAAPVAVPVIDPSVPAAGQARPAAPAAPVATPVAAPAAHVAHGGADHGGTSVGAVPRATPAPSHAAATHPEEPRHPTAGAKPSPKSGNGGIVRENPF